MQRLKYHFVGLLSLWAAVSVSAQRESAAMTVGNVSVSRSELLAAYRQNHPEGRMSAKELRHFAERFADYLLQVQEAKRWQAQQGATSAEQKQQKAISPAAPATTAVDEALERQAHLIYNRASEQAAANGGVVKAAHIFLKLPQNADKAQEKRVRERADSIYRALQSGVAFAEAARRWSQDVHSSRQGGALPWIAKGQTLKEFETVVFALRKGEMSQPFLSVDGYHIVQLQDKQPFLPYAEVRQALLRSLSKQQIRQVAGKGGTTVAAPLSPVGSTATAMTAKSEISTVASGVSGDDELLLAYRNAVLWRDVDKNKVALQRYFKEHRKQYRWDEPRIVNGRKQKAPEVWSEAAQEVLADYREALVRLHVEQLRKQYPVIIHKKVLSTLQS